MSLYLKYRPKDFDNLIGQEAIKTTLLNSLKTGRISHAYLFCGPRGTGKTTTARLIAKALNCSNLNKDGTPCDKCEQCLAIGEGRFIDLIEIDAASNTGVDNVRELQSKIGFSPTQGKKKVYVLDEVHMLSKGAFNALLKTLEEPPSFVHFVLVTTEQSKVPDTIVSRCVTFNFKNIQDSEIGKRLEFICTTEGISYNKEAIDIIAHQASGGMRDAISLLEKLHSEGEINKEDVIKNLGISTNIVVREFIDSIFNKNQKNALGIINNLSEKGYDLNVFHQEILEYLRGVLLENVSKENYSNIIKIIEYFFQAKENFRFCPIEELPLEIACIQSILLLGGDDKYEPIKKIKENNIPENPINKPDNVEVNKGQTLNDIAENIFDF